MRVKTSEELSVMLRSYENAKKLASNIYVLIQIARRDGLIVLEDYVVHHNVQSSSEPFVVLNSIISFIVDGCVRSINDLKGTTRMFMNYHHVHRDVERNILLVGLTGIHEGDNPFKIKEQFEDILSKGAKKIQYAIKRFLKTQVVEDEFLMNKWQPPVEEEHDSSEMGDKVISQKEIDELMSNVE